MVDPFYFGGPDRPLFGILDRPPGGPTSTGVVICPPLGQEAIRSHRSLKLLSDNLVQGGFSVLRFDYFGTGDSGGGPQAGRPNGWLDDIGSATQELRERAGTTRIVLVGLRLGAFLAAAAEVRAVAQLILWDPITDPGEYVEDSRKAGFVDEAGGLELEGFRYTPGFLAELAGLTLEGVRRVPRDVRILTSRDTPGLSLFRETLEARKARVEEDRIDAPPAWFEEEALGAGAVPIKIIQKIKEWVS